MVYRECILPCWRQVPARRPPASGLATAIRSCLHLLLRSAQDSVANRWDGRDRLVDSSTVLELLGPQNMRFAANSKFGRRDTPSRYASSLHHDEYQGVDGARSSFGGESSAQLYYRKAPQSTNSAELHRPPGPTTSGEGKIFAFRPTTSAGDAAVRRPTTSGGSATHSGGRVKKYRHTAGRRRNLSVSGVSGDAPVVAHLQKDLRFGRSQTLCDRPRDLSSDELATPGNVSPVDPGRVARHVREPVPASQLMPDEAPDLGFDTPNTVFSEV